MNKVYIVTSGSYSDYEIRRTFKSEKIAEKYARAIYDGRVEEFQLEDELTEKELEGHEDYYILHVSYQNEHRQKIYIHSEAKNTFQNTNKEKPKTQAYYYYSKGRHDQVNLQKVLDKEVNLDNPKVKEKYSKIITDLFMQITNLRKNEGWNVEMINEWLKNEYSN